MAVALTHKVYLWTEEYGVRYPPLPPARASNFVTSIAFSSDQGGKSILAVARHNGTITLWSLLEVRPRFEAPHPSPACCLAFRPKVTRRNSGDSIILCEDLLVGDDSGRIYYYSIDWPGVQGGSMSLLMKLDAHSQNICGLAWSPDGEAFVSGGNDNVALLFHVDILLDPQNTGPGDSAATPASIGQPSLQPTELTAGGGSAGAYPTPPASPERPYIAGAHPMFDLFELPRRAASRNGPQSPPMSPPASVDEDRVNHQASSTSRTSDRAVQRDRQRSTPLLNNRLANPGVVGRTNLHTFSFEHAAAVKAIAFAPWQPTLLATGGGSNDRQIHFHHTGSGATLAVINVFAQVTSLIWSNTRRELVATFGYAQPEHAIRIAVFSWPSCECLVSIPWERKANGEIGRALWAIPYPGGPNDAVPTRRQSNEGFAA